MVNAAAQAIAAAPRVAEGAAGIADDLARVAPAAAAVTKGMSGTGWFGLIGGGVGLGLTALTTFKETIGKEKGFDSGSLFGPTTVAIGGGAAMVMLAEKAGFTNSLFTNGMRGGGIALVLAGLAGAVMGAMRAFSNPTLEESVTSPQSQLGMPISTSVPTHPASLEGIQVAAGEVLTTDRAKLQLPVYVDPTTAVAQPAGASLADIVAAARAASQADDQDRSHAVLKAADGTYYVARLSGELDQVDGRSYTASNKHDSRYSPLITRKHEALQAIVGVETLYSYPVDLAATSLPQDPGVIPELAPTLSGTTTKDDK